MIENISENLITGEESHAQLSFEEIYNKYFERVYRFISYRVFNKSDVDDITSVVFQKVYVNLKGFEEDKGSF